MCSTISTGQKKHAKSSIRLTRNTARDAAKENDKDNTLDKALRKVAENDPKQSGSMVRRYAGEKGNETSESGGYRTNTQDPNQGKVASYISRDDETLQSYEGVHEHQYPCQIRHQNPYRHSRLNLVDEERQPGLRHDTGNESGDGRKADKTQ